MRYLSILILLIAAPAMAIDVSSLRPLPVLDKGRVKPFDTLAQETSSYVTGYRKFGVVTENEDGEQAITQPMDPVALMMDWAANPNVWQKRPLLYVPLLDLRAKLHMKESEKWISPRQLMDDTKFTASERKLEQARMTAEQNQETIFYTDQKQKRLDDASVELAGRLRMFEAAADLSIYSVLPDGRKSQNWLALPLLLSLTDPADAEKAQPIKTAWTGMLEAYKADNTAAFSTAAGQFMDSFRNLAGDDYVNVSRINREVLYNQFKPFRWAWIFYFVTLIALVAALMTTKRAAYWLAMGLFALAIGFHGTAFAMRCSITGWAPVTNMYETVIWVAMMSAIFSYILELVYRRRVIAIGGATVAMLAAIVADNMPAEWGNSIRNLTPVLRSNYWLTIHVLTIVSSYAAFALALVLGNIVLGQYIYGKAKRESINTNLLFTYRAVQIGVLLVAAGTILGGLWADVSWGRFWGWDPKEVWALIVLLTYLALLHGRYAGWIKQFGMAAGAVFCFTAVLMSWYGVNFVLGAGLHSYGFNTGGQGYVYTFVLIQWTYVLIAWIVHRSRLSANLVKSAAAANSATDLPRDGKVIAG